jgi:hypothetical protein
MLEAVGRPLRERAFGREQRRRQPGIEDLAPFVDAVVLEEPGDLCEVASGLPRSPASRPVTRAGAAAGSVCADLACSLRDLVTGDKQGTAGFKTELNAHLDCWRTCWRMAGSGEHRPAVAVSCTLMMRQKRSFSSRVPAPNYSADTSAQGRLEVGRDRSSTSFGTRRDFAATSRWTLWCADEKEGRHPLRKLDLGAAGGKPDRAHYLPLAGGKINRLHLA